MKKVPEAGVRIPDVLCVRSDDRKASDDETEV